MDGIPRDDMIFQYGIRSVMMELVNFMALVRRSWRTFFLLGFSTLTVLFIYGSLIRRRHDMVGYLGHLSCFGTAFGSFCRILSIRGCSSQHESVATVEDMRHMLLFTNYTLLHSARVS